MYQSVWRRSVHISDVPVRYPLRIGETRADKRDYTLSNFRYTHGRTNSRPNGFPSCARHTIIAHASHVIPVPKLCRVSKSLWLSSHELRGPRGTTFNECGTASCSICHTAYIHQSRKVNARFHVSFAFPWNVSIPHICVS